MEIITPELIFNKDGNRRISQSQELMDTPRRIERQVTDHVGSLIVLSNLIAGGREEGEQYLVFRMLCLDPLNHRSALLKLSQR